MTTEAQVCANRRNAAKSTGPKTTVGKAIVAANAIKHGLRACRDVVLEEDQGDFDLHRAEFLADLEPVGQLEATLADRIVSLTWRLQRAERVQNEVFDALLAEELRDSMRTYPSELTSEEEQALRSSPRTDPGHAVGRMVAKDFCGAKVLERLLAYERQIEGILRRTMADLEHLQRARRAEQDDCSKQSQLREPSVETRDSASPRGVAVNSTSCVKQSQLPNDGQADPRSEPCAVAGGTFVETPCGVTTSADDFGKQSQSAEPSGTPSVETQGVRV
jgi:hypothetical protein